MENNPKIVDFLIEKILELQNLNESLSKDNKLREKYIGKYKKLENMIFNQINDFRFQIKDIEENFKNNLDKLNIPKLEYEIQNEIEMISQKYKNLFFKIRILENSKTILNNEIISVNFSNVFSKNNNLISNSIIKINEKKNINEGIKITEKDYFEDGVQPFLHYFSSTDNCKITFVNLNDFSMNEYNLFLTFQLPHWHGTISTPQGEIFVYGGAYKIDSEKFNACYKLIPYKNNSKSDLIEEKIEYTLSKTKSMINARDVFSTCYLNGYIYAIGGH